MDTAQLPLLIYTGQLDATRYTKNLAVTGGHQPGRYACRMCQEQAAVWDHCHDHGYVRSPLCGGCNQGEAYWLEHPGGAEHLRACAGCRTDGTLPTRQLAALGTERLRRTQRHGRCRNTPAAPATGTRAAHRAAVDVLASTGTLTVTLECRAHRTQWDASLTREQLTGIARAWMTQAGKAG